MALTGDEMPIEPMLKPIKRRRVRLLPACGIGAASSRRLIGGGGEGVGEGDEGNGGGEGDGGGGEGDTAVVSEAKPKSRRGKECKQPKGGSSRSR